MTSTRRRGDVTACSGAHPRYGLSELFGLEPWQTFVADLDRGAYRLHQLDERDLVRAAELEQTYESLDLGLVDATVIVACERLGETKVATLDHRDFGVVHPRHCERLTLLPRVVGR
ncbi:MAG: VapC toxin family PIN domain ribonuclease [Actinomycetota bacterium]|nr:VapC toxin family PIN domain ribonuclease [Actinomycetota bacterium]